MHIILYYYMSFDLKLSQGDLVIQNGDLSTVSDTDKLIQDILKLCLTEVGSNPIQPWYGSFLSRTMIGTAVDVNVITNISRNQLNTALDNLKALQAAQVKTFQIMSAAEQISTILDISIIRNQVNPTLYEIYIKVLTKSLAPVNVSFQVSTI